MGEKTMQYDYGTIIANLCKALEKIREGKGAYDSDPLKHCANAVEDMKQIAEKALKSLDGECFTLPNGECVGVRCMHVSLER